MKKAVFVSLVLFTVMGFQLFGGGQKEVTGKSKKSQL